jgi:hypothetical protein
MDTVDKMKKVDGWSGLHKTPLAYHYHHHQQQHYHHHLLLHAGASCSAYFMLI